MTAPSTADNKLCLLVDNHLAVWCDVLEVHGTLPIHVDVRLAMIPSAHTVCAVNVHANGVVI